MASGELIPHLFRTEYRKIVAVLSRRFGFDRIESAEDIASDTFMTAAQTWSVHGVPDNPTAWLYRVAKNKAANLVRRESTFHDRIAPELRTEPAAPEELDLSPQNITDSQLQMMFAICHPSISSEAQIGLSLRILCGFGIEEIADAFLTSKETINKRLQRAKERLRSEKIAIEMPGQAEITGRLDNVLRTIYLLFNEGYYSGSHDTTLRKDLCIEAMRLCAMLLENPLTDTPQANALLSLMCFHASRFEARIDHKGELVLYQDQDLNLWDTELIGRGGYYLNRSASGTTLSRYHLEAAIAFWHTQQIDTKEKWSNVLQLYDQLLEMEYSPAAALNRAFALSKVHGKEIAIAEAEKLGMNGNRLYFALLGELYTDIDDETAKRHFNRALTMAKTQTDKRAIQKKIDGLSGHPQYKD